MARRKRANIPPVRVPDGALGGILREPSTIFLHENHGEAEVVRPVRDLKERLDIRQEGKRVVVNVNVSGPAASRDSILNTPGPWTKDFLDIHGLRVAYRHGRAELEFKR